MALAAKRDEPAYPVRLAGFRPEIVVLQANSIPNLIQKGGLPFISALECARFNEILEKRNEFVATGIVHQGILTEYKATFRVSTR